MLKPNKREAKLVEQAAASMRRAAEVKYVDNLVSIAGLTPGFSYCNPSTDCLNGVALGDGQSERIGREYVMTHLTIEGIFEFVPSASTHNSLTVRFIVLIDTQSNGLLPAIADIYDVVSPSELSFRNLRNSERFHILRDSRISMNTTSSATSTQRSDYVRQFSLQRNIPIKYSRVTCLNDTADISAISSNAISVICATSDSFVSLNYNCRLRYVG